MLFKLWIIKERVAREKSKRERKRRDRKECVFLVPSFSHPREKFQVLCIHEHPQITLQRNVFSDLIETLIVF